jgi:phosphorylase kinase alpha/beta subunit
MDRSQLRATLDAYYAQVQAVILDKQHPVTGLLPASTAVTTHGDYGDAWVRDNVYSILAVWGLGLAYRSLDDDHGRAYELEHRTVHLMRSLLRSMMAQSAKVEAFKHSRHPHDALHAKYDTNTGNVVVGDTAWGHLQIDATSLYLLMLVQMISSGLSIIWTLDEVNFVQNLVYYIERAYRTPDYGIWERGAKTNQGSVELNASSIGMAKAALEALSNFNLFGSRGSQASVVHVAPDNIAQANITLTSLLPRESTTKEIDAAILSVISFPAFAVQDKEFVTRIRTEIVTKLQGRYGLKRFLRDGHQTVLEDEGRLYYEQSELKQFENIESEWPLFFCYLYLDAILRGDEEAISEYEQRLEFVLVERNGQKLLPELYYVPQEAILAERAHPQSQARLPNENVPLVWAQSLYLLAQMMRSGVLHPSAIDPLGRRYGKLPPRPVVQLCFLAEDAALQAELSAQGVLTETPEDIAPVTVYLPEQIASAHGEVGRNARLGLNGRTARALKSLMTSRVYLLHGSPSLCLASFFTQQEFFLAYDMDFVVHRFESELSYLFQNWTAPGRPTVTILLTRNLLDADRTALYDLMRRIRSGDVNGVPVRAGRLFELLPTASFERIDELHDLVLPAEPLAALIKRPTVLTEPGRQRILEPAEERAIETTQDPNVLVARLATSDNLYEQIEILGALSRKQALDSMITLQNAARSLKALVAEVYEQAGRLRLWAVVRSAAGLLGKVDGDLSLAVGAILVRQKNIQVGRSYSDESLIAHPIPEHELLAKINSFCREDVRDRVLTQELLLYLSLLIKAKPELFSEFLTIRVGHLITMLTSDIVGEMGSTPDEAYEKLMHLPPSGIQERLESVLTRFNAIETLPQEQEQLHTDSRTSDLRWEQNLGLERLRAPVRGWHEWRRHRGVVDRRPKNFYSHVWEVFKHSTGVVIGDKLERRNRMESAIVLSDMTPGEQAFALWLEHLLNRIQAAEYRQLNIEALDVLGSFFEQNPGLQINDTLALDAVIGHAVRLAYLRVHPERESGYNDFKADAWEHFYTSSPLETSGSLVAALRHLLLLRAA